MIEHVVATGFKVDGLAPDRVLEPDSVGDLQEIVTQARAEAQGLVPWGGGTSVEAGNRPVRYHAAVRSARFDALLADYSPADLVVTAGAGMLLADLQAFLAGHGQRLPLEAPAGATLGGIVAGNVAGRLRLSRGTPRDWLVGLQAVTGTGKAIRAGGRVVKNVTGYDFCKLYTGSRGTLGMLTELSFKVEPLPETVATGPLTCAGFDAVEAVRRVAMEAGAAWLELHAGGERPIEVGIGFEGYRADVEAQTGRVSAALRRECVDPPRWQVASGAQAWEASAGGTAGGTADDGPAGGDGTLEIRIGVLPDRLAALLTAALGEGASSRAMRVSAHLGSGLATVALEGAEPLAHWRRLAAEAGGWAVVMRRPPGADADAAGDVFGLPRPEWAIGHEIKRVLDPDAVWSPGRGPGRV